MPTAMHPWMDPNDVELWPHGTRVIYDTFDRIFSCKGHGWANLQSLQINLPFAGDEEFARLHAAIRFLLPILPGLAASSPIIDGERNGILDNRLVVYRSNCARIPSVTGEVVPEPIGSIGEYHERLLEPIYRDLAPHDPEGCLRNEWVNARGAIARFDRMAIEIRVLDVQETPLMDVAYAALIVEVLKLLCTEEWLDGAGHEPLAHGGARQAAHARGAARRGGRHRRQAVLGRVRLAQQRHRAQGAVGAFDRNRVGARRARRRDTGRLLEHYLRHGTLATRIGKAVGLLPTRAKLERVYEELCEALARRHGRSRRRRLLVSCEHGGNLVPKRIIDASARRPRPMRAHRARVRAAAVLTSALTLSVAAQEGAPPTLNQPPPIDDQIVVIGKALAELRIRVELAENDVYARFNEINSNDLFDVHCYERAPSGSRIENRRCLSNAWREADTDFADATVRDLQSSTMVPGGPNTPDRGAAGYSHIPQKYRAMQLHTEGVVVDEMQRLAREDPVLQRRDVRLGQAYQALETVAGSRPEWTLYREVTAGDEGLPFDARRLVEVRIGSAPWTHSLTARTFTFAGVEGRIRAIRLECDATDARLEYEEGLDWTIPPSWGACTLEVNAKRGTTFAFYEFE